MQLFKDLLDRNSISPFIGIATKTVRQLDSSSFIYQRFTGKCEAFASPNHHGFHGNFHVSYLRFAPPGFTTQGVISPLHLCRCGEFEKPEMTVRFRVLP